MARPLSEAVDETLGSLIAEGPHPDLSAAALRLARRTPELAAALGEAEASPIRRALLGLEPPPPVAPDATLADRVLRAIALADGGVLPTAPEAEALEQAARDDPRWWVDAARIHVLASESRERAARMALSVQDLPYVFPGELHPMMVEVLAVGDRVLTSLHVDWMRKLTHWVTDVAVLDVRELGLWFWPQLRYLDDRKLARPLKKLVKVRRGQPGSRGLAVAYLTRIGVDVAAAFEALETADQRIAALAIASDRPAGAPASWR